MSEASITPRAEEQSVENRKSTDSTYEHNEVDVVENLDEKEDDENKKSEESSSSSSSQTKSVTMSDNKSSETKQINL